MMFRRSLIALSLLGLVPGAVGVADAQAWRKRDDQQAAPEGRRSGNLLPLREIERRVVPTMRGAQYLGFDFDSASAIYTLKFLRDGHVIWIDVDGRSGRIVGRSGE